MALSKNIKTRRTQLKMSQEFVADQLGISRQAVAKWEAGSSEPTAANLAELAALFEMSISELVDPQKYAEEQEAQEQRFKEKQRNSKMLFGRWGAIVLINTGWDGYSSGLYGTDFPYYFDNRPCPIVYYIKGYGEKAQVGTFANCCWTYYDFLYILFTAYHSFGTCWSKVSSFRYYYSHLCHHIKFEILA